MTPCALCQEAKKLCRSHIIPEFVYKSIYDEKHRALGITPGDAEDVSCLQKGIRSRILCTECERLINDRYEKPFKKYWYDEDALASFRDGAKTVRLEGINYIAFKLFHLSVLFRASVSDHENFREVDIGPHLETIRTMLLESNPGEEWQYPVVCTALEGNPGELWENVVGPARRIRVEGHLGYLFTFAGAQWLYVVSSHPCSAVDGLKLSGTGQLPITMGPWLELTHPDHLSQDR